MLASHHELGSRSSMDLLREYSRSGGNRPGKDDGNVSGSQVVDAEQRRSRQGLGPVHHSDPLSGHFSYTVLDPASGIDLLPSTCTRAMFSAAKRSNPNDDTGILYHIWILFVCQAVG